MRIEPYLFFDGRCEEALAFYREVLGAEVTALMRFKDNPDQGGMPPGMGDKVMHANVRIGDTTLMVSDGMNEGHPAFQGFALTLELPTEAEAERVFAALSEGGRVQMALTQTFFARRFGMVADRFGVPWMVIVTAPGS